MRELGPNDGLTLLVDELIPGAVPLLLPGVDHFLGPDDQRIWSTAIFRALVSDLPAPAQPASLSQALIKSLVPSGQMQAPEVGSIRGVAASPQVLGRHPASGSGAL
jgi:hypothetical protein